MSGYLNIAAEELNLRQGYWTAKEIAQQPEVWSKVGEQIQAQRGDLDAWLKPLLEQPDLRIIFTGAGTSAYVGQAIAPHLTQTLQRPVEAIATTELVANPEQYLLKHAPTLLVSFARSGSSPESVASVKLANQFVADCHHLFVTCNKNGELANLGKNSDSHYCLLMPEETLDQSFAMTSSFSAMMLAALCVFAPQPELLDKTLETSCKLLEQSLGQIRLLAEKPFKRIVFLGSGGLKGIAQEAALKMLELTAGRIDCYFESPLGFRHGPKSIIDQDTLVIMLSSLSEYRIGYETDLLNELEREKQTRHIYQLGHLGLSDVWLSFPYILYCQALAFYKSLDCGVTPDNPCPSGEVNRVVQGVTIYPFEDRQ